MFPGIVYSAVPVVLYHTASWRQPSCGQKVLLCPCPRSVPKYAEPRGMKYLGIRNCLPELNLIGSGSVVFFFFCSFSSWWYRDRLRVNTNMLNLSNQHTYSVHAYAPHQRFKTTKMDISPVPLLRNWFSMFELSGRLPVKLPACLNLAYAFFLFLLTGA